MSAKVVLYSSRYCGYCVMAARLLRQKGVTFDEIDVGNNPEARSWLASVTSRRTLPQIFINGKPIGGYDSLAELERQGVLSELLLDPPPADLDGAPA